MPQSFLLSRVLLCFANKSDELLNHLSAVALTPEGNLWVESKELQVSFDLPFTFGADRAEGITIFPCLGQKDALLVVYDVPDEARKPEPNTVFADVFQLWG